MVVSSMQHHPHHSQGPAPPQHPRPSSIVHQQHHAPPPPSQYSSSHSIQSPYQQQSSHAQGGQHSQDLPYYAHQSPYSTPGTTSGYTSADTSDMMAAAQMPRPYPPMSYHTPQSNSPASVASPSGHDQHRSIYGQPPSQLQHQSMYYGSQQPQYPSIPQQTAPSPYQNHGHQQQSMTSQPGMMMSHGQHQMSQHPGQHSQQGMTGSPRHAKMEPQMPPQLHRPPSGPLGTPQQNQNGGQLNTPTGASTPGGINNNAAPGPIPATTPLVVRQDNNGVQWIAFEYSRDRVKMEYTIRCDVESVLTDDLPADFKTENCVYPRACCPKDQYRGNRLQYETECNTVGWALAQLNPSLRGKRGLIQRAVDSWRNSNQDPRLRSRRVRRMAKMNTRKAVQSPHPHMAAPSGPGGLPPQGAMGPGGAPSMGKPGMGHMGPGMHHQQHDHHSAGQGGGDEVGDGGEYMDDSHHHHHQAPAGGPAGPGATDDVRQSHVFTGYPQHHQYPSPTQASAGPMPPMHHQHDGHQHPHHSSAIAASTSGRRQSRDTDNPAGLFPDLPADKKRKFILVEDNKRNCRLRVRVTLENVDTKEIPDSFRKSSSVFPRSYFPREMQSPPPSATGSRFFEDDLSDNGDDSAMEVEGGRTGRSRGKNTRGDRVMVKVPMAGGAEGEVAIPGTRRAARQSEVKLNDLGYRMAWLQSRVFSGRTVFLQKALDNYRTKTRTAIETVHGLEAEIDPPHYVMRPGKRRWTERMRRSEKADDDE